MNLDNLSDPELMALVKHYNLDLEAPDQYKQKFSGLNDNHYDVMLQNINSQNKDPNALSQKVQDSLNPMTQNLNAQKYWQQQVNPGAIGTYASPNTNPAMSNMSQQDYWHNTMDQAALRTYLQNLSPEQIDALKSVDKGKVKPTSESSSATPPTSSSKSSSESGVVDQLIKQYSEGQASKNKVDTSRAVETIAPLTTDTNNSASQPVVYNYVPPGNTDLNNGGVMS